MPEPLLWRAARLAEQEAIDEAVAALKAGQADTALAALESLGEREVMTNVRGASISDEIGIMAVEISGQQAHIDRALTFLANNDVKVEPIEKNVIE